MQRNQFSTVEMTVLGMTWLRGPCTTYAVMKELSHSESTFHRSRAGTAYSVMNRLVTAGYVERLENDLMRVTPTGEAILRDWTGPEVPMRDVAHSADLLRLRFFFLEILPPAARLEFIDRALVQLREFETRLQALVPENQNLGDYFGALATVCSLFETRARIQWLEFVRPLVEHPLPDDVDWSQHLIR